MMIPSSSDSAGGLSFRPGLSERDLTWWLQLVDGAVRRGGAHLLLHEQCLIGLITAATSHNVKGVRKVGGKLLRHTLRALTEYYPAVEGRSAKRRARVRTKVRASVLRYL